MPALCHPHLGASGSLEGVALTLDVCITCEVPRIPILQIFEERSARFVENNISCEVCPSRYSLWCVVIMPLVPHSEREHQRHTKDALWSWVCQSGPSARADAAMRRQGLELGGRNRIQQDGRSMEGDAEG